MNTPRTFNRSLQWKTYSRIKSKETKERTDFMNILAVGAHPDDLEISCGGTLAKYARLGHTVFMVHVASGNAGSRTILPDELRKIRRKEAQKAGELIGAETFWLGADDLHVSSDNNDLRDAMVDIIRQTKPDIIITHNPDDYMDDHNETSKLVFRASMAATVPHHHTSHGFYEKLTPIYYMDTLNGIGTVPTEYVDITDDIEMKIKMMASHESQISWLKEHDNIDFPEFALVVSRFRGAQCDVKYAEGFTFCLQAHKIPCCRYLP